MTDISRHEHMAWCKERALAYVDAGDLASRDTQVHRGLRMTDHSAYIDQLRAELAERRDFRHVEDSYLRQRWREEADVPEHPETTARGEWEDEVAWTGGDREERDPLLDDGPHPGGPRWSEATF